MVKTINTTNKDYKVEVIGKTESLPVSHRNRKTRRTYKNLAQRLGFPKNWFTTKHSARRIASISRLINNNLMKL